MTLSKVVVLPLLILQGCASNYSVTYDSNPQGAALVCGGANEGTTPKTISYDIDEIDKKLGFYRPIPCGANWISGAYKPYDKNFDLTKFPNGAKQIVQRPSGDGYSQDEEFALKIKKSRQKK